MAILSAGGGSWFKWSDKPVGTIVEGAFSSFTPDVPGQFGKQDILRLDTDEGPLNMACPAMLASTFKRNVVAPGTKLRITYKGKVKIKGGKTAHDFQTETLGDEDISFPPPAPPAPPPVPADEASDLEAKLAAIKAKKEKRASA